MSWLSSALSLAPKSTPSLPSTPNGFDNTLRQGAAKGGSVRPSPLSNGLGLYTWKLLRELKFTPVPANIHNYKLNIINISPLIENKAQTEKTPSNTNNHLPRNSSVRLPPPGTGLNLTTWKPLLNSNTTSLKKVAPLLILPKPENLGSNEDLTIKSSTSSLPVVEDFSNSDQRVDEESTSKSTSPSRSTSSASLSSRSSAYSSTASESSFSDSDLSSDSSSSEPGDPRSVDSGKTSVSAEDAPPPAHDELSVRSQPDVSSPVGSSAAKAEAVQPAEKASVKVKKPWRKIALVVAAVVGVLFVAFIAVPIINPFGSMLLSSTAITAGALAINKLWNNKPKEKTE